MAPITMPAMAPPLSPLEPPLAEFMLALEPRPLRPADCALMLFCAPAGPTLTICVEDVLMDDPEDMVTTTGEVTVTTGAVLEMTGIWMPLLLGIPPAPTVTC